MHTVRFGFLDPFDMHVVSVSLPISVVLCEMILYLGLHPQKLFKERAFNNSDALVIRKIFIYERREFPSLYEKVEYHKKKLAL